MNKRLVYTVADFFVRMGTLSWLVLFVGVVALAVALPTKLSNPAVMATVFGFVVIGGVGFVLALLSLLVLGPPKTPIKN